MKTLLQHIKDINTQSKKWMDENSGSWAGMVPEDIKFWNDQGIFTVEDYERDSLITSVYYRGRLKDKNVIELPEYWKGLVDSETITVNLTPHGSYQELFVKSIEWGSRVIIVNNAGGSIDCSYVVYAERKDVDKLVVEYKGTEPKEQ